MLIDYNRFDLELLTTMTSSTIQLHELPAENEIFFSSEHSEMRPASTTCAAAARLPPLGSEDRLTADGMVMTAETTQAMEYLESETGFSDYFSYAANFRSPRDDPADRRSAAWQAYLDDMNHSHGVQYNCAIIDLFKEELSPSRANLRCEKLSAVQALQSLRAPPKEVKVQIVLWSFGEGPGRFLDPDFVTVFGLGLKLIPRFFQCIANGWHGDASCENNVNEWSLPEYLLIDGNMVAIGRDCPLAKPDGPPVLFIVASSGFDNQIRRRDLYHSMRACAPSYISQSSRSGEGNPQLYAQLLTALIALNPDCANDASAVLFESLLPLLQLNILRMRAWSSRVRLTFWDQKARVTDPILDEVGITLLKEPTSEPSLDHTADATLYQHRVFLRSSIDSFDALSEPLMRFISSQLAPEVKTSPAYHRTKQERSLLAKETYSLEAEIRDFLQLQASQLSLLESRKSIELSNDQFEENKRGK